MFCSRVANSLDTKSHLSVIAQSAASLVSRRVTLDDLQLSRGRANYAQL